MGISLEELRQQDELFEKFLRLNVMAFLWPMIIWVFYKFYVFPSFAKCSDELMNVSRSEQEAL